MPQYVKDSDNSYLPRWGCAGLVVGIILVLLSIMLGGCHEPMPKKSTGKIDTIKAPVYVNGKDFIYFDSTEINKRIDSLAIGGTGTAAEPLTIKDSNRELLYAIQKEVKLLKKTVKDTAYRHNIMQIGDTIYYAVVKQRKGNVAVYFHQSYTDKNLFIHDKAIDTITP